MGLALGGGGPEGALTGLHPRLLRVISSWSSPRRTRRLPHPPAEPAGCEIPVFEPPAVEALFQSAHGLPRLVTRIAHYALTVAARANARAVNVERLQHAVEELRL